MILSKASFRLRRKLFLLISWTVMWSTLLILVVLLLLLLLLLLLCDKTSPLRTMIIIRIFYHYHHIILFILTTFCINTFPSSYKTICLSWSTRENTMKDTVEKTTEFRRFTIHSISTFIGIFSIKTYCI